MRDLLRERVHLAAEAAQRQSKKKIYDSIRLTWRGKPLRDFVPKVYLSGGEVTDLLSARPADLSMDQLLALGDHIEIAGLGEADAELIAANATAADAFPLPPVQPGEAGEALGKSAAMRYAIWVGYIATPALIELNRFDQAVELLESFTNRLTESDYDAIEGSAGGADPELRFLLLAPVLAGLTQYCPGPPSAITEAAHNRLTSFFNYISSFGPLTECIKLRLACLGLVARLAAAVPLFEEAEAIAAKRYERRLADAFRAFRENPEELFAADESTIVAA
jgi:hypothetical protein